MPPNDFDELKNMRVSHLKIGPEYAGQTNALLNVGLGARAPWTFTRRPEQIQTRDIHEKPMEEL